MVGEQPSLWSKLELKFWVKNEEEEYEHMNQWTSGRIQDSRPVGGSHHEKAAGC